MWIFDRFFNFNETTAWFLVFLKINVTNPVWCDFFLIRLSHRNFVPITNSLLELTFVFSQGFHKNLIGYRI